MNFVIGLASGIALVVLIAVAHFSGRKYNRPEPKPTKTKPPTADEIRDAARKKAYFDELMSYNVEKARGPKIE